MTTSNDKQIQTLANTPDQVQYEVRYETKFHEVICLILCHCLKQTRFRVVSTKTWNLGEAKWHPNFLSLNMKVVSAIFSNCTTLNHVYFARLKCAVPLLCLNKEVLHISWSCDCSKPKMDMWVWPQWQRSKVKFFIATRDRPRIISIFKTLELYSSTESNMTDASKASCVMHTCANPLPFSCRSMSLMY